jgi:predicted lysophospholipase L1 biosynthesis ABC-type transport system permease subunit
VEELNPLAVLAVLEVELQVVRCKVVMVKAIILVVLRLVVVVMAAVMLLRLLLAVVVVAIMVVEAAAPTVPEAAVRDMSERQLARQIQQELIPQVQLVVL